jgi:7-cyano-7-deazaguanine synthase
MTNNNSALVLFSGGQDSTICLADALSRYDRVETIGFEYGQTHQTEMDCRDRLRQQLCTIFPHWKQRLGPDHVLPLPAIAEIGGTALTGDGEIKMLENGLPSTFVPGRNILFFSYAAALAYRRGLRVMIGGMCETDFSGYPDCRRVTLDHLQATLSAALEISCEIETPLMWLDKAQTWQLADKLGGQLLVDLVIEDTHSCYRGDRSQRHDWGYGCNDCPACELRAAGYEKWRTA